MILTEKVITDQSKKVRMQNFLKEGKMDPFLGPFHVSCLLQLLMYFSYSIHLVSDHKYYREVVLNPNRTAALHTWLKFRLANNS